MKGPWNIFDRMARNRLRSEARAVKAATQAERAREDATRSKGGSWSVFREDMREYLTDETNGIARAFPEVASDLAQVVETLHAQGRKALMLDLFGETDGRSLGADETLCLALTQNIPDDYSRRTVAGDALDPLAQRTFLREVDASDAELVFGVLNPVGGLHYLIENDRNVNRYAIPRLAELAIQSFSRFTPGGIFVVMIGWMNEPSKKLFLSLLEESGVTPNKNNGSALLFKK